MDLQCSDWIFWSFRPTLFYKSITLVWTTQCPRIIVATSLKSLGIHKKKKNYNNLWGSNKYALLKSINFQYNIYKKLIIYIYIIII